MKYIWEMLIDLRKEVSIVKKVYIVRHCEAEGQESEAPLTAIGHKQAQ